MMSTMLTLLALIAVDLPLTGLPCGPAGKEPAMWETWVQSLGWDDPLEKEKATPSSILVWRIPWTIQSCHKESDKTE